MKKVELHQLQTEILIARKEALAIENHGKLLGYFYPIVQKNKVEVDALWERLDKAVERVIVETGLDEEGLVEALAPKKSKQK
ncbi:MAG: hypothetical protein F6K23_18165 [Okeania sp. SIO2C9]|uniref:hypothetical protein n=1 Tax=Okeania sp. SIO2C9 TaxID=2607791 RepID=UPI0013BFCDD7|nr:hypothetical protein [Okeania sp. SIO2C9]NEQ74798.1 hypothetical protein [Okeania sp. SIO2C9]